MFSQTKFALGSRRSRRNARRILRELKNGIHQMKCSYLNEKFPVSKDTCSAKPDRKYNQIYDDIEMDLWNYQQEKCTINQNPSESMPLVIKIISGIVAILLNFTFWCFVIYFTISGTFWLILLNFYPSHITPR
jgi:hypothetical protein